MGEEKKLTGKEYGMFTELIYEKTGIRLTGNKGHLLKNRLASLMKEKQFTSFSDYYNYVVEHESALEMLLLIDKISTHYTYFFREKKHFDYLTRTVLPQLEQRALLNNNKKIRIWSAGCSSGEEVYTLAMIIREYFGKRMDKWDIKILGTDISLSSLAKAEKGIYTMEHIESIPASCKLRYFENVDRHHVRVTNELKEMVLFKRLNLKSNDFPFTGTLDAVFCRNVMIYFDDVSSGALVDNFARYLSRAGYLFIGHSESLLKKTIRFIYKDPGVYQKSGL